MPQKKILFLCTGNSCRSQMAEGWARQLQANLVEAYSAGTMPQVLNPLAVRVMNEAGIDISTQRAKHFESLAGHAFELVVTVCDSAKEACPIFPGAVRQIHVGFDDPPGLVQPGMSENEILNCYRRVRDEIQAFVINLSKYV